MKRAVVAALAVCALLPGAGAVRAGEPAPQSVGAYIHSSGTLKVGDPVPAFRAKDIYGTEVNLKDLIEGGRKPLLAFWSMYCQSCIQKFKAMVIVQTRFAERGIAVISVNTDGEYQKGAPVIRTFIAEHEKQYGFKVNFPVLYDERNWLPQALNIEFLPTIIAVDSQARVAGFYQQFGENNEAQIVSGIEKLAVELLALYPPATPVASPGDATGTDKK